MKLFSTPPWVPEGFERCLKAAAHGEPPPRISRLHAATGANRESASGPVRRSPIVEAYGDDAGSEFMPGVLNFTGWEPRRVTTPMAPDFTCRLPAVAGGAQPLPIALIPEQCRHASMRHDVVNLGGRFSLAHGTDGVRGHEQPTQHAEALIRCQLRGTS